MTIQTNNEGTVYQDTEEIRIDRTNSKNYRVGTAPNPFLFLRKNYYILFGYRNYIME